ncbi:MAG: hypothetical protein M3272_05885, partial [Actinomycetota bacterium]|nr:hypothetical protein [Actinomycetota bacterium]
GGASYLVRRTTLSRTALIVSEMERPQGIDTVSSIAAYSSPPVGEVSPGSRTLGTSSSRPPSGRLR